LLELIKSELESGDDVMISGSGIFCVKNKKKRKGRNQEPGHSIITELMIVAEI
jgi:integration host factor subunit alpha